MGVSLNGLLQSGRVSALERVSLVAVLKEVEGGDGADAELKGEIGDVVGVEAGEGVLALLAVLVGVLLEEGRDGLAGTAPGGVGLDGDVGSASDELVELGLGLDVNDGHGGLFGERAFCCCGGCCSGWVEVVGDEGFWRGRLIGSINWRRGWAG